MTATAARVEELRAAVGAVRARIVSAATCAGRTDVPELVVVTKFFPAADLMALADLGVTDIGENREQELSEKVGVLRAERPDLLDVPRRHFIGQLQSKKAKHVARLAHVVHSVDREKVLRPLDAAAQEENKVLTVLLQVDLGNSNDARGGVMPEGIPALAEQTVGHTALRLGGLMAVAPLGQEPARAFERLAAVRASFLADHPDATMLSAGMSADLEDAVRFGATHLRVGSAILGSRPAPR